MERGIIEARRMHCRQCEQLRLAPHWKRAHCAFEGADHDRTDEFLAGKCPAGLWAGLEPLDVEAEQEKARQAWLKQQQGACAPLVKLLRNLGGHAARVAHLEPLVQSGLLHPELAANLVVEVSNEP